MMRKSHTTSGSASHREGESKTIQRQAAEWLAIRQAHEFTPTEQAAFAAWCSADPRHEASFAEVEAAWRTFDRLADYPRSTERQADPDLLAPWWRSALHFRLAAACGTFAAAAAIVIVTVFWSKPWRTPAVGTAPELVAAGASRFIHFTDGSEAELNAGSDVVELFTAGERRVRLVRGEAHFTVTKDPARPFVVMANGVAVRAVGTAFDVRIDAKAVQVLVTEGKVRVGQTKDPETQSLGFDPIQAGGGAEAALPQADLVAGQRVLVPIMEHSETPTPLLVETLPMAEIDRTLAWQSSRLIFDSTPLAEAVIRFNHRMEKQPGAPRLLLGDADVGTILVSGRIRPDNAASFLDALESGFPVTVERRSEVEFVLKSRR